MSNKQLTKIEALELVCPVVDGEATDENIEAFKEYIKEDPEVRDIYRSMQKMKKAVSEQCPRATAPDSLVHFLKNIEDKADQSSQQQSATDAKVNGGDSSNNKNTVAPTLLGKLPQQSKSYLYAAAASLLLIAAIWGFFNFSGINSTEQPTYVENHVLEHFNQMDGQLIKPTIATSDIGSAEVELMNRYKFNLKVPFLKGTNFEGVAYREFIDGFKTPMLKYSIPEKKDTIFVYAFKMSDLSKENRLLLFPEAIKSVIRSQDYYIRDINGRQMVHWKWNNIWYTAISRENGYSLAARIEELQNNVTRL